MDTILTPAAVAAAVLLLAAARATPSCWAEGARDAIPAPPAHNDDLDVVSFAAGAIEMRPPPGWIVTEVSVGREVRLYITPQPLGPDALDSQSGVWITYHLRSGEMRPREIEALAAQRVRSTAPDDATFGASGAVQLAGRRAVHSTFRVVRGDATAQAHVVDGEHFVVSADWGVVEIQTQLPASPHAQRQAVAGMLAGLALHRPAIRRESTRSETIDAADVIGTWKAERSRMVLSGDGRVVLQYDPQRRHQLDLASARPSPPPRRLTGQYEARGDLLLVTWEDGSRLNLRWRVADGDLLLTDHQGRVSQLKRLLE